MPFRTITNASNCLQTVIKANMHQMITIDIQQVTRGVGVLINELKTIKTKHKIN